MSTLQNQLAAQERHDVARAVRGLLRTPWVSAARQPDLFDLVRRRETALTTWFGYYPGWELRVETELGFARLVKRPSDGYLPGDLRPLRRRRAATAPFDRLRYVLLCVVAAEALDLRLVTIGELADRAARSCAADPVLPPLRTDRQEHRRAFVDAVVLLEELGALTAVDGQTLGFTEDPTAAVLYRVSSSVLHHLLVTAQGPSLVLGTEPVPLEVVLTAMSAETGYGPAHRESARLPAEDVADPGRPTAVQRSHWARHSFLRRLLDDAVVYRDDLTPAQESYLASPTGMRIVREAAEGAGFALEERAEGFLLVDPDRVSGPDVFPGDGAASAAGLHTITDLLARAGAPASRAELAEHLGELMALHPAWARTYRDDDGATRLLDEALALLRGHGLVHEADGVVARPAAARYRDARLTRSRGRRGGRTGTVVDTGVQDELEIDTDGEEI